MQVQDQASGRRFTGQIQRDPDAPKKPDRNIQTPPMARVPSDGSRASAVPQPNDGTRMSTIPWPSEGRQGQPMGLPMGFESMDRMGEVGDVHMTCM